MMKIRHKKIVASGTAVALAGILGVGALLQSNISVQASPAMMPGIEQIVNDTTAEKPFKILEIVDDTSGDRLLRVRTGAVCEALSVPIY